MARSVNDIAKEAKGLVQNVADGLEARSNERSQQIADSLMASTQHGGLGRRLWLGITGFFLFLQLAAFSTGLLERMGHTGLSMFLGLVAAVGCTAIWHRARYTQHHPFWSALLCNALVAMVLGKLGF